MHGIHSESKNCQRGGATFSVRSRFIREDPPYKCEMIEEYYLFTIYSPTIYLPLITE